LKPAPLTIKLVAMVDIPGKHIAPLEIAGLRGRVLELPAQKGGGKTVLLIYGLHSSLERMYSTAQFHSRYAKVIMPDLPGIGGMESFYKIGRKPDLESYADYLYAFIKSRREERG